MAKRDFRLLVACRRGGFRARLLRQLSPVYRAGAAASPEQVFRKLKSSRHDLLIIEPRFGGIEAREWLSAAAPLCPQIVFMVTPAERKQISKQTGRQRAMDYLILTPKLRDFTEKVHKVVRWAVLQNQLRALTEKIAKAAKNIEALNRKIEKAYPK